MTSKNIPNNEIEHELKQLREENKKLKQKLTDASSYIDRCNLIIDNSLEWVWEVDVNGVYTYASDHVESVLGYKPKELIGKTPFNFMNEDEAKRVAKLFNKIASKEKEFSKLLNIFLHKDGTEIYTETSGHPFYDEDGLFLGYRGIDFDRTTETTNRINLEKNNHTLKEKLLETNTYLAEARNIAKIGHWDWDILTNKLFWSNEIYQIFGYQAQEFEATYEAFLNSIYPDDKKNVTQAIEFAIENNTKYNVTHRIVLPDGTINIVHEVGYAVYDENNKAIQMRGTVQDITQIKNIENELAEQKEAFETIFEYSADGTLLIENGKFIACNQAITKIMRASSKRDFLNTHPAELSPIFQPDGQASSDKAEEMMDICIENGYHTFEWVHIRTDGEHFWAEVLLTRLNINNRIVIHVSWRDISERKKLENDLEASNTKYKQLISKLDLRVQEQSAQLIKQSRMAQMGELLSMIAHQWRQPLGAIASVSINVKVKLSLANMNDEDNLLCNFVDDRMNEIETYVKSLSSTIDDFRTLYKTDKIMKIDSIVKPIHHALTLLKLSFDEKNVTVVESHDIIEPVMMHNNEIMQVILNLLKNAEDNFIEKNTKNPTIKIHTAIIEDNIKIDICDNGGGVSSSLQDKIFDPYFSTKSEKNGTGLGLYMCKIIIEEHHKGKIHVSNVDDGACFTIQLPIN